MGRWTYYSPMALGFLLILALNEPLRQSRPPNTTPGAAWTFVALCAVAAGLMAQLVMLGLQGVSAQVLPAPGGRSMRGPGARLAGYFILLTVALLLVALLLMGETLSLAGWTLVALAALSAAAALMTYAWQWPTAQRDFAEER